MIIQNENNVSRSMLIFNRTIADNWINLTDKKSFFEYDQELIMIGTFVRDKIYIKSFCAFYDLITIIEEWFLIP